MFYYLAFVLSVPFLLVRFIRIWVLWFVSGLAFPQEKRHEERPEDLNTHPHTHAHTRILTPTRTKTWHQVGCASRQGSMLYKGGNLSFSPPHPPLLHCPQISYVLLSKPFSLPPPPPSFQQCRLSPDPCPFSARRPP